MFYKYLKSESIDNKLNEGAKHSIMNFYLQSSLFRFLQVSCCHISIFSNASTIFLSSSSILPFMTSGGSYFTSSYSISL